MEVNIFQRAFIRIARTGLLSWIPDEAFLRFMYLLMMGKRLHLKNPRTYNEKLQWLKIYDRKNEYTRMVDKYLVKELVKNKIGEEFVIPLLGVWDDASEIDYDKLPDQFVLKCNHDSGSTILCQDKSLFDRAAAEKKLNEHLKRNKFDYGREWPYKNVRPKIIAESFVFDRSEGELLDYKVYCFQGEPKLVMVNTGRNQNLTKANYYDSDYNRLDFKWGYPAASNIRKLSKECFAEMLNKACILSKGIPHVRVDFYVANGRLYFGELTFFDGSGFAKFDPPEWDRKIGEWLILPQ